jgi:hypothetical protein
MRQTRIKAVCASIAALLLAGCAHGPRKEAEKEISLPPSFSEVHIRVGMSLAEAHAAYPEQKPEWSQPRLIGFQFSRPAKELAKQPGLFALPTGAFYDEKLGAIFSVVAFNGKSLDAAEIDRMQDALMKECEAAYGADHDRAVTFKSSTTGNEYSQTTWNEAGFKAILSLPRIKDQGQPQRIATLEVAAKRKPESPHSLGDDILRDLFGNNKLGSFLYR